MKKQNKKKWYSLKDPISFFMNKFYDKTAKTGWAGFYMDHLPAPFLKSSIEECWNVFKKELISTTQNRFRTRYDVNQYLFTEYMLCKGTFCPDKYGKKGFDYNLGDENGGNIDQVCLEIKKQKYKTICLNDVYVNNFDETKKKINDALNSILPEKSAYEL